MELLCTFLQLFKIQCLPITLPPQRVSPVFFNMVNPSDSVDPSPTPAPAGPTIPADGDLHWLNLLFIALIPAVMIPLCIIIASRCCCRIARKRQKKKTSSGVGGRDTVHADDDTAKMTEGDQGEAVNGLNTKQNQSKMEKGGRERLGRGEKGE